MENLNETAVSQTSPKKKKKKKRKKRDNAFCEVELLSGQRLIFQFPNDLRDGMLVAHKENELASILTDALVNVPTSAYSSNGRVKLHVGRIVRVFVEKRSQHWRTRGQFLTQDMWKNKLDKAQLKFILHDHSLPNKIRIFVDVMRWRWRAKSALKILKS